MDKQNEITYLPIEELKLEKDKTVFITSYPRSYSTRTNFYYQSHKLSTAIMDAMNDGKDTFISMNKSLFEVLCTGSLLFYREQFPHLKIYHVCFNPPEENSAKWKSYIKFTRFCSIQKQLDGNYFFSETYHYNTDKLTKWLVEHCSLMIGYFSLQEFVSSIAVKAAKKLQLPIINLFDDRELEKTGDSIPFEILHMIRDSELKKILSRNYHSNYGACIKGTVFSSPLYHKYCDQKSDILQRLSSNTISIETIQKLTLELNKIEMKILKLIAEKSYQVGITVTLPDKNAIQKRNRKNKNVKQ